MSSSPAPVPSLARRLTRRAIDLLVVAFLIVVGLSTGQQLIDWWRTDPGQATPDLAALNTIDLDWNRTPVTLRFGDASTSLQRRPFQGGRKELERELTRIGQSIVTTTDAVPSPLEESEKGWLDALNSAPPVFWDSNRGNVYLRYEPLPSFVATRFTETSQGDASAGQRIVGWGLAFPVSPGEWTIYIFHPDSAKSNSNETARNIEPPASARNVTCVRGADGCQWLVIQGRGNVAGWVQHFDNQFGIESRLARVDGPEAVTLKYRREQFVTDVQIQIESDDQLTGVIWTSKERESR